jgi:hypothetical protein
MDAGVFDLLLARGNEADLQCLRFDDHARHMAFDQLAIRKSGRQLRPTRCRKVPADRSCCGWRGHTDKRRHPSRRSFATIFSGFRLFLDISRSPSAEQEISTRMWRLRPVTFLPASKP